mmetsp:Transcript_18496/g.50951  ORF Transcript_18496/g.50951 Transcript_18496/m.50951 type:complete len:573 (-) Transcript_18496:115-1833(-)
MAVSVRGAYSMVLTAVSLLPVGASWVLHGPAQGDELIELTFAVKQQRLDELERTLLDVSDPDSPRYGQYLSRCEVDALTAPRTEDVELIMRWLQEAGVERSAIRTTGNSDFIALTGTASQVGALMQGRYFEYRHASGASALRMQADPVLPKAIADVVDFVSPTTQRLPVKAPLRSPSMMRSRDPNGFTNTPASLRRLYSLGNVEASTGKGKQAVTGFLEEHRTNSDLQEFFALYYRKGVGRKIGKTVGDGAGEGHVGGQVEAELDTQYVMAIGGNVETEFWSFKGRAPHEPDNEPFLKFLTTLANTSDADVPLVISSSYGEDEDLTALDYAKRCNAEFQKAGVRGISLLFSSGDSGVAGIGGSILNESSACGSQCPAGKDCFVPQWPAASPWVTSVGGTKQWPTRPEIAWDMSSGGVSVRWPRPAWQKDVVGKYLSQSTGMPDASKYSSAGRAFPDVAAQAVNFMVILDRVPYPVSGTSCASPTFAGVVSLLNDLRLGKGQPPLGFLPPLLYSKLAPTFTDITTGANPGCDSPGFPATAGWDAVTGLGTPNYQKMAEVIGSLAVGGQQTLQV